MSGRRCALALGALLALAGCQRAEFSALTAPPPDREGSLHDGDDDDELAIRLSRGVALAFSCTYKDKPCSGAVASTEGAGRIQVATAYVDELRGASAFQEQDASPTSAFVIVGLASGHETLSIRLDGHRYAFDVTVVDP